MSSEVSNHRHNGSTARPAPQPIADAAQGTVAECVVFSRELNEEIRKRRMAVCQAEGRQAENDALLATCPEKLSKELVGLSLSGGGVRSASFSVGLLQALGASGFMKYVDYLSTVSGGGYTGALFSSLALKPSISSRDELWRRLHPFARDGECNYDHVDFPLDDECSFLTQSKPEQKNGKPEICRRQPEKATGNRDEHQQNNLVQRLAYGGDYLFRSKAEFASKFVAGFVLNNLVLLSGLIATCALIAWIWRWLDSTTIIYHIIRPLDGKSWLSWKWWQFESDNVRPFFPLFFLIPAWLVTWPLTRLASHRWASILRRVMFAAVIASALIGVAMALGYRDNTGSTSFWDWQNSLYPWIGVAGALLPFVRPKLLMQSAVHPKNQIQSYAFVIASTMLLVGLPLFGIFWFGREDFAGSSANRTELKFRDLIAPERLINLATTKKAASAKPSIHANKVPEKWSVDRAELKTPGVSDQAANDKAQQLQSIADNVEPKLRSRVAAAYNDRERFAESHNTNEWAEPKLNDDEVRDAELTKITRSISKSLIGADDSDSAPDKLPVVLISVPDPVDFLEAARFRANDQFKSEWQDVEESERQKFLSYYQNRFLRFEEPRLRELLSRYRRYGVLSSTNTKGPADFRSPLDVSELKELNRLILNAWYPAYFHTRAFISTPVVFSPDQWQRFYWFLGAALVCLVFSYVVNPNATSIQGYYRDRLNETFVEPTDKDRRDIRMAHLDTCDLGAPYHLICGTATLKTMRNALGLRDPDAAHDLDLFLFSKLFCGSRTLRYAPTGFCLPSHYDTLGNAIAISGAAIAPDAVNNLLLRMVMTVLNLRQGQWLPNPSESRNALVGGDYSYWRPNYFWLLLGLFQPATKQRLCFVTDGGHRENLGLAQLLLRRCRLIICSDAGCDPTHQFDSLAKVLRLCDMHLGIRFEEIDLSKIERNKSKTRPAECGTDLQSEPLDLYTVKHSLTQKSANNAEKRELCSARERSETMIVDQHFVLARIIYPDAESGLLVYLKPSLTGDENEAIENYRAQNPEFPHESTSDQDYDPAQFSSYVMLGRHIGEQVADLFSPQVVDPDSPKQNWWQTNAVAIERLIVPYVDAKRRRKPRVASETKKPEPAVKPQVATAYRPRHSK